MCKQCYINPVYEFTNKRKLCRKCFMEYFQKKVFYTIRKFKMIKKGEVIGYRKNEYLNSVVLKEMLNMLSEKINFELIKLPSKRKTDKIADDSCLDTEANEIVNVIINKDASRLKDSVLIKGKTIKPLGLFLEEEILLYAKIRKLKFKEIRKKKSKTEEFVNELENKHPEIKRAIVNGMLEIYGE